MQYKAKMFLGVNRLKDFILLGFKNKKVYYII